MRKAGHTSVYGGGGWSRKYCSGLAHRSQNKFHRNRALWVRGVRIGKSQCSCPARWTLNPVISWCIAWTESGTHVAGTGLMVILLPGTAVQRHQLLMPGGPAILDGATRGGRCLLIRWCGASHLSLPAHLATPLTQVLLFYQSTIHSQVLFWCKVVYFFPQCLCQIMSF